MQLKPQTPALQAGVALAWVGQTLPQELQLLASVWRLTHVPLQLVVPMGQHLPLEQIWPSGQHTPLQQT
jgi:hypothetical protein